MGNGILEIAAPYDPMESAIYLNRYLSVKQFIHGKRVLDIGCKDGYGCKLLKAWGALTVVGMDSCGEHIEKAKHSFQDDGITFVCGDLEHLPFDNSVFDVVLSFEMIECVDHPKEFLKEIMRVKKSDATVVLSAPNDPYYAENIQNFRNDAHKTQYHFFEFKDLAEAYLGRATQWFYGFPIDGFMNLPIECGDTQDHVERTGYSILKCTEDIFAADILSDKSVNQWNCNYFLGVWNAVVPAYTKSTVVYPRESFVPHDIIDPMYEVHQRAFYAQCEALQKKIHTLEIEKERTAYMLRLANEEKACLWGRISGYESVSAELDSLCNSKGVRLLFLLRRVRDKIKAIFRR